jgi:hypothetical protein
MRKLTNYEGRNKAFDLRLFFQVKRLPQPYSNGQTTLVRRKTRILESFSVTIPERLYPTVDYVSRGCP